MCFFLWHIFSANRPNLRPDGSVYIRIIFGEKKDIFQKKVSIKIDQKDKSFEKCHINLVFLSVCADVCTIL